MSRGLRSTQSASVGEDVTDKAGWLYADLFLALMVIFLATISFVPEFRQSPTSNSETADTNISRSSMDQGGTAQYSVFDPEKLAADIAKFKEENGLSSSAEIVYVQVVGGYDAATERINTGTLTAVTFGAKMKSALPELFAQTAFKIDTSPQIPSKTVSLRFVFAG